MFAVRYAAVTGFAVWGCYAFQHEAAFVATQLAAAGHTVQVHGPAGGLLCTYFPPRA